MAQLTTEQLTEIMKRVDKTLETRVIHMVSDTDNVSVQVSSAALSVVMSRVGVLMFLHGVQASIVDIAVVMYMLGKIDEREGWVLEYDGEEA